MIQAAPEVACLSMRLIATLLFALVGCKSGQHVGAASGSVSPSEGGGELLAPPGPAQEASTRATSRGSPSQPRLALQPIAGESPTLKRLREGQSLVEKLPKKADAWVTLGRLWMQHARETADPGFYMNARECADSALTLEPASPVALALLSQAQLNAHQFAEAVSTAERAIAIDRSELTALSVRSDALVELGRLEDATAAVQAMMDLKPNLAAYSRTSYLRWLHGDRVGAKEAVRLAITSGRSPGDPEAHAWVLVQAAMIFWHEGDYGGADAGFDMALASFPGYAPAWVGKGRVALSQQDGATAARWFEQAFKKSPLVETAWLVGDARALSGDAAGAAEAHATVVRRGRLDDPRTLASFLATKKQDPAGAVRLARVELKRRADLYSQDTLGFALFRAGQLAEARVHLDAAARHGTKDASLLFHRGALLLAQGDKESGQALLREALALNPGFSVDGAREAKELLAP